MKLLDLLKSLNTGKAVDPDARLTDNAAPQRAQLLDDLAAILAVLDTPDAPSLEKTDPSCNEKTNGSEVTPTNTRAALLNLAAIFEEEILEEKNIEEESVTDSEKPLTSQATSSADTSRRTELP